MKICDYELYKAVYCGLCKELASFGIASRMTLSYDFAFLALLYMSVNKTVTEIKREPCMAHAIKKTSYVCHSDALQFTAAAECISVYHKIKDDIKDGNGVKKLTAKSLVAPMKKPYEKAKKLYPDIAKITEENMSLQYKTESEKCPSVDRAAEPTAAIMSAMAARISDNPEKKRILARMGYLLGRFIYLADALDDAQKDFKSGNYNPLLLQEGCENCNPENIRKIARDSIYFTLGELSNAYVLLDDLMYKPIIDNVIYMGLPYVAEKLLRGEEISGPRKHSPAERNEII